MQWNYAESPDTITGEAHASTIVEAADGSFLCAWFGGARESSKETDIWMARYENGTWGKSAIVAPEPNVACWNPVLFRTPDDRIWLFYKSGDNVPSWAGVYKTSDDNGYTWSETVIMPAGVYGPIKNKPIMLSDGRMLCPSSAENYRAWTSWMHIFDIENNSWALSNAIEFPGNPHGLIQPTVWEAEPGHIVSLMRSTQDIGVIARSDSFDNGETWSPAEATELPNPNSGIDAVKLADGRVVLIYNHTTRDGEGRSTIHIAVSDDDAKTWSEPWLMEDEGGEYSYPAVIQAENGDVHVTYTWFRKGVRHAVFTPDEISKVADGTLPKPA